MKASLEDHYISVQDVTQAYTKVYDLECDLYIKTAEQLTLATEFYIKFLRPLYGLPKSGYSWFQKYKIILKTYLSLNTIYEKPTFNYKTQPNKK